MNIYEKLAAVQQELKAPKDKKNTYGGYNYRSAEGILESVKPVLAKYKATIILTDQVEKVGSAVLGGPDEARYYINATAQFVDIEAIPETSWNAEGMTIKKAYVDVSAYAREEYTKKGMDASQITGTASSYARKYALNGLLLIDDTKDADTDEYAKVTSGQNTREKAPNSPEKPSETVKRATEPQIKTIRLLAEKAGLNIDTITKKPLDMFTPEEATKLMLELRKKVPSEA